MRIFKSESGQVLVLTAMCTTILVGFLAMAIDVGILYRAKRNTQIAADAAAVAAAQDYLYNQAVSSAQTVGKAASAANGYTDGSGGVSVTVNMPPQSGPNQSTGYAEVIVNAPNPTFFMRAMGFNSVNVAARAVAGTPTNGDACIWLLASSGNGLSLQGSYDIQAPSCGIYINSNSSDAISVTGGGGIVNAKYVDVVGNSVPSHETSPTPVTPNTAPRTNPWGNLQGPNPSTDCSTSTYAWTAVTTSGSTNVSKLTPNSNGVVCFTNSVTIGSGVNLPGSSSGIVYVFENGVTIGTGATVSFGSCSSPCSYNSTTQMFSGTPQGAVMDLYGGTLTQDSSSLLNVYAPTSGTYSGIGVLQPPANTNELQVQFGSNNEWFDGYIYAPGAEVYLQDNGGGVTATGIVANQLYDKASSITIPDYDQANPGASPNRVVTMVE